MQHMKCMLRTARRAASCRLCCARLVAVAASCGCTAAFGEADPVGGGVDFLCLGLCEAGGVALPGGGVADLWCLFLCFFLKLSTSSEPSHAALASPAASSHMRCHHAGPGRL